MIRYNLGWTGNLLIDSKQIKQFAVDTLGTIEPSIMGNVDSKPLRIKLSEYLKVPVDWIAVGVGSSEIIYGIVRYFKDHLFVDVVPNFGLVNKLCDRDNIEYVPLTVREHDSLKPAILELSNQRPIVLNLSSPRNPYGYSFSKNTIFEIAQNLNGIVVIDQAYVEFGGDDLLVTDKYPENVIVVRSFSKAWGLANFRIGYAVWPNMTNEFREEYLLPWSVSEFSQKLAINILEKTDLVTNSIKKICDIKSDFVLKLENLNDVFVWPSDANFVCIELKDADLVEFELKRKGIQVTDLCRLRTYPDSWPMGIRVSIGPREAMEAVASSIKGFN